MTWIEEGGGADLAKVSRARIAGGAPEPIADGFTRASGLAVHAGGTYVTADAFGDTEGSVFVVGDGGATPIAATGDRAVGIAVERDASVVHWAARKGAGAGAGAAQGFLRRTPVGGGRLERGPTIA